MVRHVRPDPGSERVLYSQIYSTAQRLGRNGELNPQGQSAAVAELRNLAGDRTDLLVQAAGIMLGCHPPRTTAYRLYRIWADLLLKAADITEDHENLQRWIAEGKRRTQARQRRSDPPR
jgi:hypothetical protein